VVSDSGGLRQMTRMGTNCCTMIYDPVGSRSRLPHSRVRKWG
jgi:hypothetical protein